MENPFSKALRAALTASGYSLDQLSRELRQHGTPASVSTLSNWQTGENHPERPSSIAAVASMETVLGLPPRSLTTLIPPRRARGRRSAGPGLSHRFLWRHPEALTRLLAKFDATPDDLVTPTRLSRYGKVVIDEAGHERETHTRVMLQATRDGTERCFTAMRCYSLPQPPTVYALEGCRLGRFRADAWDWPER